ncbi:MAG: prepilin-type N-terminal cleavage/methylation domain-containing protein [Planctomycetota bacterium]|nr:prepilin-type N-terminal cleavage/methylation domain-containing protein [Planctomycetota bacterium]
MNRSPDPRSRSRSNHGFSLVELLVVIAIIAVLIALLFVSVSNLQASARLTQCMSNQHQLQVGLVSFSQDNNGKFMSPASTYFPPGIANPNRDLFWVKSYNQGAAADGLRLVDNSVGQGEETEWAIRDGALYDYVGDVKAYSSPLDTTGRIRTYALNGFISDIPDNPNQAWGPCVDRISKIRDPSNTLYTIAEFDEGWEDNFNRGGWVVDIPQRVWKDTPAFFDPRSRLAMSFVDGSSRIVDLKNPELQDAAVDPSNLGREVRVSEDEQAMGYDFEQFAEWLDPTR